MFINLPFIFTTREEYNKLSQEQKSKVADKCILTIFIASILAIVAFNSLRKSKIQWIIFRGLKWFFSSVITGVLIMAHFPVALINYVIFWPLILNSVRLIHG